MKSRHFLIFRRLALLTCTLTLGLTLHAEQELPRLPIRPAPTAAVIDSQDTDAFRAALNDFADWESQATFPQVDAFLQNHPASPWKAALLANLGRVRYQQGCYSLALVHWQQAWNLSKSLEDSAARRMATRTGLELAGLYARLGRAIELEGILVEMEPREIPGSDSERLAGAKAGLSEMLNRPERSFKCGPYALRSILRHLDAPLTSDEPVFLAESTDVGFHLDELRQLSEDVGLNYQSAYRTPGSSWITPAVVHWRSGHYAAILKQVGDRWLVRDPTFQTDLLMTTAALENETSGYFLIPSAPLTIGRRTVAVEEAETIFGKGAPSSQDEEDGCGDDETSSNCPRGMPAYSLSLFKASLIIRDLPLSYRPPVGPEMNFLLTYDPRSTFAHDDDFSSHLGPKWTLNWLSYVEERDTGGSAVVQNGSGKAAGYVIGSATPHARYRSKTTYDAGRDRYIRTHPDGSSEIFGQKITILGSFPRYYLTTTIDPQGNTVTIHYDSLDRITSVEDAMGRHTLFGYDGTDRKIRSISIGDTAVPAQPTNRKVTIAYDLQNRLETLTDAVDIETTFSYNDDFINSMITPYGETTFVRDQGIVESSGGVSIEATDPMGRKERVEYSNQFYQGVAQSASEEETPSGTYDFYENWRWPHEGATLYWDHKTYRTHPPSVSESEEPVNREFATQIHWMRKDDNWGISVPVRSSFKRPLENRLWYSYPNRGYAFRTPMLIGPSAMPDATLQVLDPVNVLEQFNQFAHNDLGHPTRHIDPVGRETERIYATNQIDLLEIRQKTGASTWETLATFGDYAEHLPGIVTDAAGKVWYLDWNAKGQLLTLTDPNSDTTTYTYDHRLDFDPVSDTPSGYGYLYKIEGAVTGSTTTFTYNSDGRPATVTDSEGHTITLGYDDLDRLVRKTYPDATFEKWDYLHLDVHRYTDRLARTTTYLHNANRQLMVETDPEKRITQYDYCSCGAISRLIDPNGNVTRWKYDIQGRVTEKILPDATKTIYQYDPYSGRLINSTDALGQTTEYTYHLDDIIHEITFPDAIHTTAGHTWIWNPNYNRPATLTDGTGTTTWTYHPNDGSTLGAGQIHTINGPLTKDTITRTYDSLGRPTGRQINGTANTLTRQFDSLGRLNEETNRLGTFGYQYLNETHQPEIFTYPDGQSTVLAYKPVNEDRRLERIEHRFANSTLLAAHEYGHDDEGTITTWKQERSGLDTRTWHFGYDAATRLTSAILKNPAETILKTQGWQYDPGDNRIASKTDANGLVPTRHNKLNQLTEHGSGPIRIAGTLDEPGTVKINDEDAKMRNQTLFEAYLEIPPGTHEVKIQARDFSNNTATQFYEIQIAAEPETQFLYDLNGNLTTKTTATGTTTFQWDALDRLITIIYPDTSRSEFTYDGFSRRVRIIEKDATSTIISDKRHLWDDLQIAEERATNGSTVTKRFYPQGVELVTGPAAEDYTYRTDHLGSIREVVNSSGTLTARYDYDAWGVPELVSGTFDLDFRYTGHYYHQPSGLHLAPFRAYDAAFGRWLNADPLGESGGVNLYGYVTNDPLAWVDELGLFPEPPSYLDGIRDIESARKKANECAKSPQDAKDAVRQWEKANQKRGSSVKKNKGFKAPKPPPPPGFEIRIPLILMPPRWMWDLDYLLEQTQRRRGGTC